MEREKAPVTLITSAYHHSMITAIHRNAVDCECGFTNEEFPWLKDFFQQNPECQAVVLCSDLPEDVQVAKIMQTTIIRELMGEKLEDMIPVQTINGQNPKFN